MYKREHCSRAEHRHGTISHCVNKSKVIRRRLQQGAACCKKRHVRRHVQKVIIAVLTPGDVAAGPTISYKGRASR